MLFCDDYFVTRTLEGIIPDHSRHRRGAYTQASVLNEVVVTILCNPNTEDRVYDYG